MMTHPALVGHYAGVDTHADTHLVAVIDADGRMVDHREFLTSPEGLVAAVSWLTSHGPIAGVGVEGSASYGLGLTQLLLAADLSVVEVTRPNRQHRRSHGKTDVIDAYQAADAARTGHRISPVKHAADLAELRTHQLLRASAVTARTQIGHQLATLAHHHGQSIGKETRLARARRLTNHPHLGPAAQRWLALHTEAHHHTTAITAWLNRHTPALLAIPQVGPDTAAKLVLAAGNNPDRLTTEAAFARLCGVAPVPASSGKTHRHRLHRGGDRQANNALWRIAMLRLQTDPRTQAYAQRRTTQGKTRRDTLRCLKRYIAREIFTALKTTLDTQ